MQKKIKIIGTILFVVLGISLIFNVILAYKFFNIKESNNQNGGEKLTYINIKSPKINSKEYIFIGKENKGTLYDILINWKKDSTKFVFEGGKLNAINDEIENQTKYWAITSATDYQCRGNNKNGFENYCTVGVKDMIITSSNIYYLTYTDQHNG